MAIEAGAAATTGFDASFSRRVRRTALCTLGTGPHAELLELARPSLEAFAGRHGWELVCHTRQLAPDRPASWGKVVAIHHLAGAFDRVVWVDADAVVVDGSVDLASELRPGRLLAAVIHRYRASEVPNLGVCVVRGGRRSRRLLERMWRCPDLVDHPWWENAALLRIMGYRTSEPVTRTRVTAAVLSGALQPLDPRWNSTPDCPAPDPRIVHLAGRSHDERALAMRALVAASAPLPTL